MPFITEEIYQTYFKKTEKTKSIHISNWPECKTLSATKELELFYQILAKVRQAKSKQKKSMKAPNNLHLGEKTWKNFKGMEDDFASVSGSHVIPCKSPNKFKVEFLD